jgi:DNA-binding CsgD family transcriptional regulator
MTKPVKRRNGHSVLTQAEETIIALLGTGLTAKEIAHARGVKLSTVRAQIRSIFEKTGIRRQADLVRLNHRCAECGAKLLEAMPQTEPMTSKTLVRSATATWAPIGACRSLLAAALAKRKPLDAA